MTTELIIAAAPRPYFVEIAGWFGASFKTKLIEVTAPTAERAARAAARRVKRPLGCAPLTPGTGRLAVIDPEVGAAVETNRSDLDIALYIYMAAQEECRGGRWQWALALDFE